MQVTAEGIFRQLSHTPHKTAKKQFLNERPYQILPRLTIGLQYNGGEQGEHSQA